MTTMPLPDRGERAVCRRCRMVMDDCEPMGAGEWFHPRKHKDGTSSKCTNAGKSFFTKDIAEQKEVEPFMRKRTRRATKNKRS